MLTDMIKITMGYYRLILIGSIPWYAFPICSTDHENDTTPKGVEKFQ